MKWIENILVAVDVSCNEHQHLEDAAKLALREQATITLLTVLPKEAQNPSLKNLVEQYATDALEKLRQSLIAKGISEVHIYHDYGDVAQSIINGAQRTGADLVVLYEKHSDTKHLISEVVKKVIRLSPVPVWTTLKGANSEIKKILCPVDCSAASKSALALALRLASWCEASVHVLYVFEPITHVPTLVKVNLQEINREGKKQAELQFEDFLRDFHKHEFTTELAEGKATEKILEHLSEHDLLVMGTNGRTGLSRIVMGSVTEAVIRNAPCSFVTTHAEIMLSERAEDDLEFIELYFGEGVYNLEKGRYEQAIKFLLSCLDYDKFHVPARLKLAEVYHKIGNLQEAKRYRKQAEYVLSRQWGKEMAEKLLQTIQTS